MIQIGFDNYVSLEAIRAVGHPGAAPMTRLMSQARVKGRLVDFTAGRRCKANLTSKKQKPRKIDPLKQGEANGC